MIARGVILIAPEETIASCGGIRLFPLAPPRCRNIHIERDQQLTVAGLSQYYTTTPRGAWPVALFSSLFPRRRISLIRRCHDVRALRPSTISRRRSIDALRRRTHTRTTSSRRDRGVRVRFDGHVSRAICGFGLKACPPQDLIVSWCECYNGAPDALPLIDSCQQLIDKC